MRPKNWPFSQVPRWHICWTAAHTLRNADTSPSQVLEFWAYRCLIIPMPLLPVFVFFFFFSLYSLGKPSPLLPDSERASLLPGGLLQIFGAQIYTLQYLVIILSQCLTPGLPIPAVLQGWLSHVCALLEAQEGFPCPPRGHVMPLRMRLAWTPSWQLTLRPHYVLNVLPQAFLLLLFPQAKLHP